MALPKIKHPTYSIVVPSTKQDINIRPFTVQEEKLLLMARQSEDQDDVVKSIKQIITNCVIEKIDVDKLSTFDIEYIFIKLRAKSVGELVDLEYQVPDSETNEVIKFKLNLDEIEVKFNPDHKNKFIIINDVGVVMRYPTLNEIRTIESGNGSEQSVLNILIKCVESIFDQDSVYDDFTEEEVVEFINNLPLDAMQNMRTFFETMPTVEHTTKVKNKAGKEIEVTLRGLNSFFT